VNEVAIFELLIRHNANVHHINKDKETTLMIAAGNFVLWYVVIIVPEFQESNAVEIAKILISKQVSINSFSKTGSTAICYGL
jgi:hypothetical protein